MQLPKLHSSRSATRAILSLATAAALLPAVAPGAAIGPTPVALSGTATPAGGTYTSFGTPVLNASGQVAYVGNLTGVAASPSGIFAGAPGSVQAAALQGTAAPAGGNYSTFNNPVLNASGQVAYVANLFGASSTQGVFAGAPGSVQAVALQGTAAPRGGNYASGFVFTALNAPGQVAFSVPLEGAGTDRSLFAGAPGSVQAVAVVGEASPAGGNYSSVGGHSLNASGQLAYNSVATSQGIYFGVPGSVQAVALPGMAAPGAPGGETYSSFLIPTLNASGQVAYVGNLTSGSIGLFAGTPGSVQAVALQGTAAPAGGNYSSFGFPVLNASGQVAFQTVLAGGSSTSGIFAGSVGSLQTIARGGTAAPGGGTFNTLGGVGGGVSFNASGQVAFLSSLTGTGVTTANDNGLYAGSAGNVVKIVREGDILDIDPGVGVTLRTVNTISFTTGSGGENGKGMGLNDDGLLVYGLTFTTASGGGSGIFTSQIVPEPAGLSLLALAGVGLLRRRRSGGPAAG